MAYLNKKINSVSPAAIGIGLALAAVAAMVVVGLLQSQRAAAEVAVVEAVCGQLLDNSTVGRQALVSSVWWPPLPVLLRLPLVALFGSGASPVASVLVSAVFGLAALLLLERILRGWHLGRVRYLILAGLIAAPSFLRHCLDGSSATTVAYLALTIMYGLVEWVATRRLRHLIYLAFGAALLVLTSFEMLAWVAIVFILLIVDQVRSDESRAQKEAALILALLPAFYAAGLWLLMNWLIMGDWIYFLRPLLDPGVRADLAAGASLVPRRSDYVVVICVLPALLMGLWMRRRGPVYGAIAVIGILVTALLLASAGMLWNVAPLLSTLFPVALVVLGQAVRLLRLWSRSGAFLVALLPLCLAFTARVEVRGDTPGPATLGDVRQEQSQWRNPIRGHALQLSPHVKVFVCGYDSLSLLGDDRGDVFVHALDLNFNQVKQDYYGQQLYILVHRPIGRSALESIGRRYPGIYRWGHRNTLYDGDWGDWRLFEVIQAPRYRDD